jgi:hypothetical protein
MARGIKSFIHGVIKKDDGYMFVVFSELFEVLRFFRGTGNEKE